VALIAPQYVSAAGPVVTYTNVAASDTFAPEARGVLLFRTAGTGATITFTIPLNTDYGQANPDPVVTMGATEARAVSTAELVRYRDGTTGLITYTTSSQTNHTVAYVVVPPAQ
jgi:hypothetical protein